MSAAEAPTPVGAKARWSKLDGKRSGVLTRARDCADLTIPSLLPPEGHTEDADLPTPYQSLGSRGVNNLASKLSLALLPPGNSFYRLQVPPSVADELNDDGEIEEALRKIENRGMRHIDGSNTRLVVHSALKHLIVSGNALLYLPTKMPARAFRLTQYVVVRDGDGEWQEIVVKELQDPSGLDEGIRTAVGIEPDRTEDVEVYTHVKRTGDKVEWHQEIEDKIVPDSQGRSSLAESPFIPLRWSAVEGEHYGRSHVEEYLGDLRSLEGLSKAIVQGAAIAAKVIFLENPNSITDTEELEKAESGEIVTGREEDISVLQVQKHADMSVAKQTADDITLRLSHAFLLTTGTIRNAERVTAEEVRLQAQELEDVLGGVYTVLSQELQMPLARRNIAKMRATGEMPKLPKGALEPVIVTGFDALGRGHELNKYRQYFTDGVSMFGEAFLAEFKTGDVAKMMATQYNVDIKDLLKTPEEKAEEQQQQMGAGMLEQAAGPFASAAAEHIKPQE